MKTYKTRVLTRLTAITLAIFMADHCLAAQHVPDVHITTTKLLNIEPVGVHVVVDGPGAIIRGAVYRGPGYEIGQKNHLLVEVVEPNGHTNLSQMVAFSPSTIHKVGRASGRSHFALTLKEAPAPGSSIHIIPQEGECPNLAANGVNDALQSRPDSSSSK